MMITHYFNAFEHQALFAFMGVLMSTEGLPYPGYRCDSGFRLVINGKLERESAPPNVPSESPLPGGTTMGYLKIRKSGAKSCLY
ncbi:hypothetical protein F6P93_23415 (plasmid) [Escherichia coli]|nr:hypothetical protein F6P93_23415 [Escherichia coli]